MWVPGPGAYFDAGPRDWPGCARVGSDIRRACRKEGSIVTRPEGPHAVMLYACSDAGRKHMYDEEGTEGDQHLSRHGETTEGKWISGKFRKQATPFTTSLEPRPPFRAFLYHKICIRHASIDTAACILSSLSWLSFSSLLYTK